MWGRGRSELLMLLGALLLFVGPALEFLSIEPTPEGLAAGVQGGSFTGYESGDGSSYLVFGALVLLSAVSLLAVTAMRAGRMLALLGLLGALVCLYAAFIDVTATDPAELAPLREISSGPGTWVVAVGAALSLFGALGAFRSREEAAAIRDSEARGSSNLEEDRPQEIDKMSGEVPQDHSQSVPEAESRPGGPAVGDAFRGGS